MKPEMTPRPRVSRSALLVSLALLLGLVIFTLLHAGEARRFALLAERAQPRWLLLAVALQLGTYLCAGAVWARVVAAADHRLRATHLARLSVEKLSVDQFMPTGGMSGNLVVLNALRRMGLSTTVATEALLVDTLAHYAAFALVAAVAVFVLWLHHGITPILFSLVGLFALVVAAVPLAIVWLLAHRSWRPGSRLSRLRVLSRALAVVQGVSVARVRNPRLLGVATGLHVGIFLLDAMTLWAMLAALGIFVHPLTAFVAVVIATIAALISFLPGGVGSFEAGAIATLTLLGVPVEAALTGTLLLRGLSLWLPLVPGLVLARGDLAFAAGAEARAARFDPTRPLVDLFEALQTNATGLTTMAANDRRARFGWNSMEPRRHGALFELGRALSSPLALILVVAALASAFLGEVADAVIIVSMVTLSAGINLWQTSRSARAVHELQAQVTPTATVLRDGVFVTLPRVELVPGDVIRLSAGDLVPADARLLESTDLHMQQAALTGESAPSEKQAAQEALAHAGPEVAELVYIGTSVVSGAATAVVFATGAGTAFGDIAARLAERPEETELERGMRHFGMLILQTVTFLVLFLLVVSIAMGREPLQSLLFAVALAVGLTPEYLPMITTVTLASGASRMAREKVIVKHLASIQNLGSIDVLCSDKTGTLTTGSVTLAASIDPLGGDNERALYLGNLNSTFETGVKSGLDAAILARKVGGAERYVKVDEVPFDFERRRLSVIVARGGETLLVTKGAPESVLLCCTRLEVSGAVRALSSDSRAACLEKFRALSRDGYRVLAVAYRVGATGEGRREERDLVLAGFLTFADPLLAGVDATIRRLREDGVAVKILSGDNELVTGALCRKVGLDAERVVTGAELEPLDEPALARLTEDVDVFARISPSQKHRLVMAMKRHGHVVGFLGDGINDAPSLHGADVGISVAGAVDVAQEASDILLLERRLDVLHAGIVAGRRSFANVLKYLLMGTSSNFGNMLSMAGAVFFLPFLPMLPTQILVNNFLYDLAQITIPSDNVDAAYLRGPRRWDIGVIRRFMLVIGPISSVFDFLTFAALLVVYRFLESQFQTGWFIESLTTQVLVLFVIRTMGRPWQSRPSFALVTTVCLVLAVGVTLPLTKLAGPLGMTPLPWSFYAFVALLVPSYLAIVEVIKRRLAARLLTPRAGTMEPRRRASQQSAHEGRDQPRP